MGTKRYFTKLPESRILSPNHAIYITPGPFSIFRKEVFEKLGGYKRAHNTEDIEIALRMQKNGYKITHAHNAFVYTVAPKTLPKLLKQRVRWSYGLIKNTTDYRDMIFNKKYGNLGLFVLPMAILSIVSILFVSSMYVISMIKVIAGVYTKIQTVGFNFNWSWVNFDWFYINTGVIPLIGIVVTIATVGMVLVSRKMSDGKMHIGMDLIYYFALYMFIAPLWITKATYNALFGIKANWR
jgi:cellulose synthase/poly-beta-1,6-N-acetylglucosamine synthase-like glycosyltransferase